MPVVLVHQGPTVTAENYRATVQKLTGKDKLESVSDWPVAGILSHAAGESPSGFRVVDVWESQEACEAFGQQLATGSRRGRHHGFRRRCTRRRPSFRASPAAPRSISLARDARPAEDVPLAVELRTAVPV